MEFWLKRYIYLLPITLLGVDIISLFVKLNYIIGGNIAGYSLFTNILFVKEFWYGKYCWFTKLLPFGLIAINIINIIGEYISDKFYNFWYVIFVLFVILTLTIIKELEKKIKNG